MVTGKSSTINTITGGGLLAPQIPFRFPMAALALTCCLPYLLAQESVGVSLTPPRERKLTSAAHEGHTFREQAATLRTGVRDYQIAYKACVDPAHAPDVAYLEGYIGMPLPTSCNWYHSGFLFLHINGRDIGLTPLSTMLLSEQGARGMVDLVWHDALADVRARFCALPGQDHLLCEIAIEPKEPITSILVKLRCYPSFFTAHHKRDGARRVKTPAGLVEQGEAQTLPAAENWYALYYDEVFDVARGEGEGPCAVMLSGDPADEIAISPGGYSVETTVTYPPEARRIRLAFWDFKAVSNADALARLETGAATDREALEALDFTPATIAEFDVAAVRAELQRAVASAEVRELLGDKLQQAQQWLDKNAATTQDNAADLGITAQEELLQSAAEYRDLMWEIKLAELVSGL